MFGVFIFWSGFFFFCEVCFLVGFFLEVLFVCLFFVAVGFFFKWQPSFKLDQIISIRPRRSATHGSAARISKGDPEPIARMHHIHSASVYTWAGLNILVKYSLRLVYSTQVLNTFSQK